MPIEVRSKRLCQAEEMIGMAASKPSAGPGRRAGFEAIDLGTRGPLYLASGSEPLAVLLFLVGQPGLTVVLGGAIVVVSLLHAVACILLLRAGLAHFLGGPRPARLLIAVTAVLTGTGVVLAALLGGWPENGLRFTPSAGAIAVTFGLAFTCAVAPLLSAVRLVGLVVAVAAGAGLLEIVAGAPGQQLWALNYLPVVGGAALSYRFSIWFLGVAWEMNRAREVQARLAVAEERLRFARDLHDVLGRNLALIAVNSQLAAELVRRGQEGAVERMLDVHRTAQDSMREVREVVAGSHATDLDSELAGARSVLRSAGIGVRVIGDGAALPPAAQVALGWVVREATTNIIRHSDPTTVRIDLEVGPVDSVGPGEVGGPGEAGGTGEAGGRRAVLRIANDGVRAKAKPKPKARTEVKTEAKTVVEDEVKDQEEDEFRDEVRAGTGLAGLRERLAGLGGDLSAGAEPGDRFVVRARLPLAAGTVPLVSADRTRE
jgi:two-component system sensor histidine kinase DesK